MTWALIATRIFVQIPLMVRLSIPPLTGRQNFRDYFPLVPLLVRLLGNFPCYLLLLCIMVEDSRAVLGAGIWPLAVRGRGIVHFVEEFEELSVGDFGGVVGYLESFCVCGALSSA